MYMYFNIYITIQNVCSSKDTIKTEQSAEKDPYVWSQIYFGKYSAFL